MKWRKPNEKPALETLFCAILKRGEKIEFFQNLHMESNEDYLRNGFGWSLGNFGQVLGWAYPEELEKEIVEDFLKENS